MRIGLLTKYNIHFVHLLILLINNFQTIYIKSKFTPKQTGANYPTNKICSANFFLNVLKESIFFIDVGNLLNSCAPAYVGACLP